MTKLHIDFETYSEAPISKVGAWAYSAHPSTLCLIMAWAFDNDAPTVWIPGTNGPPEWMAHLDKKDPGFKIYAWNDFFEYCILKNVLKTPVPSPKYWVDVAASAAALSLPRSLGECGKALNLPAEYQKDPEGDNLIKIFSVPRRYKGRCIRTKPSEKPADFKKFVGYCLKDVISEQYISNQLKELSPINRACWELDRKINLRGVRFDMPNVYNAIIVRDAETFNKEKYISALTNNKLLNVRSRGQFMSYLKRLGVPAENAQAEYLKRLSTELKDDINVSLPSQDEYKKKSLALKIIAARLSLVKTSLGKYDKLLEIVPPGNDTAHGLLRWHGAGTGRWSGNLFQPHNLPRPTIKNANEGLALLKNWDPDVIKEKYGDVMEFLSSAIRGLIIPSAGCRLIVSDFSQIESRMIRFFAGDTAGLDAYSEGLDIYKVNAAKTFKVPYDRVDSDQRLIGKVIELACGYQGGVGAFQRFADVYGVIIPDAQAKDFITTWRAANPKIVDMWRALEYAAVEAVRKPGTIQSAKMVKYVVKGEGSTKWLFCKLPSGRCIAYHKPHLSLGKFDKPQLSFWGVDAVTHKYSMQHTYGGALTNHVTQGSAFDRLVFSMPPIESEGYKIRLTVHDEIIAEREKGKGSIAEFNNIMKKNPAWCSSLPIDCEGYESDRYKK